MCARCSSCSDVLKVLSNWSSSCSFLHHNFFLWIIEAGLAAEAETAAAHQLPYANAPYHSPFIKYNQEIWGLLGFSVPVIYSKHWHAFFLSYAIHLYQYVLSLRRKEFLLYLVMSDTIFILKITLLHNMSAQKTLKWKWKLNFSPFLWQNRNSCVYVVFTIRSQFLGDMYVSSVSHDCWLLTVTVS